MEPRKPALAKARRQLSEITSRLARGKGRKSKEAVAAEIASVLSARWLDQLAR
jgi:hypothetical protein